MNKPYDGTHIVHITDTTDPGAQAKIASAYVMQAGAHGMYAHISIIDAPDSVTVGVNASELVNNRQRAPRLILAVNCAPPDREQGTENNHRNDFYCADLGEGISLCGTKNGFEFSYLKERIRSLYRLTTTNSRNSQFRSLEVLPEHAIKFSMLEEREKLIASGILEKIEIIDNNSDIRDVPDVTHVFQVDNFGNVKLYLSDNDYRLLSRLSQKRGEIEFSFCQSNIEMTGSWKGRSLFYSAIAAPTLFAAPIGTNVVAAASSSTLCGGIDVPIIATIRPSPANTAPEYAADLPMVGDRVLLRERQRRSWWPSGFNFGGLKKMTHSFG